MIKLSHETKWPILNPTAFFKICYVVVFVFLLSFLKVVEAADLPAPPFQKLWICSVGEQVGHPTFCDKVICFFTWPQLKSLVYGAVDLQTGKILWKKSMEGYHLIAKEYENDRLYIAIEETGTDLRKSAYTGRGEVLMLEPHSGFELLRIPIDYVGSDPVIKDGTVYCVFGDDVLKSIDLGTQKTIWAVTIPNINKNVEGFDSSIHRKRLKVSETNLLIEDHNRIVCVNRQTGEVRWRYETNNEFWSIQVDDNGENIYQSFKRELKSVNPVNGRQNWSVLMKSDILWETLPYRGLIFLTCREDGMLYALQADSGKVIWKCYLSDWKNPIITRPVFQDNTIILEVDRKLVAIFLSGIKLWEWKFDIDDDALRGIAVLKDGYLLSFPTRISRYTMEKN